MIRFLILVTACLVAICSAGYVLAAAVAESGETSRERYQPRPGDILAPVENDEPPNPGANLEAKLRSLVDDRNRKVAEARLDLGRSATQVVQLIYELDAARRGFNGQMAAYRQAMDYWNSRAGEYGAVTGGPPPVPDMPMFPFPQIEVLEARFRTARSQFEMAKNSDENRVQMIQNEFLRQFIDIVGKNRASQAPPIPHTAADDTIDKANNAVTNFANFMSKIYSGYKIYNGR